MSSNLIEFLMLFPGENFNFLKKELFTIPGFIIVTLISDLLHSSLKDLTKPKPSSVERSVNKKTLMKIRSELKSILDELEK